MKVTDNTWSEYVTPGLKAYESGNLEQAEKTLNASLHELERAVCNEEQIVADVMHLLANTLRDQDKFAQANHLYERAAKTAEITHGRMSTELMKVLRDYALSLCLEGKFMDGCGVERKALKIAEANAKQHRFEVSYSIARLCAICSVALDYKHAETYYRRFLTQLEETLGNEHPRLVNVLCDLGLICYRQRKHHEAETFYKRALEVMAEIGATEDAKAPVLNALGLALCAQNRQSEAQPLCHRAASSRHRCSKHSSADEIQDLADVYCSHEQFDQARVLCEDASTAREINFLEGSELANALFMYATILERLNSCEKTDKVMLRIERLNAQEKSKTA